MPSVRPVAHLFGEAQERQPEDIKCHAMIALGLSRGVHDEAVLKRDHDATKQCTRHPGCELQDGEKPRDAVRRRLPAYTPRFANRRFDHGPPLTAKFQKHAQISTLHLSRQPAPQIFRGGRWSARQQGLSFTVCTLGRQLADQSRDEAVLVVKVVVNQPFADPCHIGDVLQTEARRTVPAYHRYRGLEDSRSARLARRFVSRPQYSHVTSEFFAIALVRHADVVAIGAQRCRERVLRCPLTVYEKDPLEVG